MNIKIYTDGSAKGNPGPGGYGIVLLSNDGHRKEVAKGFRKTTNNRMELLSVIVALEMLKVKPMEVVVFSDSKYVVDAVEKKWLFNWEKKFFNKATKGYNRCILQKNSQFTPLSSSKVWRKRHVWYVCSSGGNR